MTDCPDKIPVNRWGFFVATLIMKAIRNSGKKAREDSSLKVSEDFYHHENSKRVLYKFINYKDESSHLPFKVPLLLG